MRASDILVKALELWGPTGEGWCQGSLRQGKGSYTRKQDAYCLYGGIGMAAQGKPMYEDAGRAGSEHSKALMYVRKAITERSGRHIDIANYNDYSNGFAPIKAAVCAALKYALADEDKETNHEG